MKDPTADFFYPGEPLMMKFGMDAEFAVIKRLSKNLFMIQNYRGGWLRNAHKERFGSYEEAALFASSLGYAVMPKKDFVTETVRHGYTSKPISVYAVPDRRSRAGISCTIQA
jgi:hypothetical protein